jgi:phosphoglycerate dehydrogenase-like enzyme
MTDSTYHLIGERELAQMKPSAYLVNLARGPVVDTDALIAALRDGVIAGAGLDVFEQEPLPADAAIWDAPNVIITPHMTAEVPDLAARSLDIIEENVRRYKAGLPMLNRLVPSDVYSKPPINVEHGVAAVGGGA